MSVCSMSSQARSSPERQPAGAELVGRARRGDLHIERNADEETLQELLDAARSLSPVFDTVTKPVAVAATLQKES